MSLKDEPRIFVGGLSWDTDERQLQETFGRFGKVVDAQENKKDLFLLLFDPKNGDCTSAWKIDAVQNSGWTKLIMLERDTGRPRGFGFVTFIDHRAVDDAIAEMHGRELSGRTISVNKAQPKAATDDTGYGYGGGGGYSSGGRGGYRNSDGPPPVGRSECFKCGRSGHWARECPSSGGGEGGRMPSRSRFGGGNGGRGDRFTGSDRYSDRYVDDRYDAGRYSDRDRVDSRDRYGSGRDRYGNDCYSDRYAPSGDRYTGDKYGGTADRYPQSGYVKERSYERVPEPRTGGNDRYKSSGPTRYEGGSSYRERPGPYDRPSRGGRPPSYEDRYP